MRKVRIARVNGDGAAPEMMAAACAVAKAAAMLDDVDIEWVETPLGWNALECYGHTCPEESLATIARLGLVTFGGVGDTKFDDTIGKERPDLKPETAALLALRKRLGLVVNVRPVTITNEIKHLSRLKFGVLPEGGLKLFCFRILNEDTYFGMRDLLHLIPPEIAAAVGFITKDKVTGQEERVAEIAYYSRANLEIYFRTALTAARSLHLPVISLDKANIMPRYAFWRIVIQQIRDAEFPDVELRHQLIDSASAMVLEPERLHGVIVTGNEQGDTFTDCANGLLKLGMMYSSAINPVTGAFMAESGAGTACDKAGLDIANPIGRIRANMLLLDHIGAKQGAAAIDRAFIGVIGAGWRTRDIFVEGQDDPGKIVGTWRMGELFLERLAA